MDKTQCAVGRHTAPGNLTQNSVAEQESSERNTSTWCRLKVNLEESAVTISWTKKNAKYIKKSDALEKCTGVRKNSALRSTGLFPFYFSQKGNTSKFLYLKSELCFIMESCLCGLYSLNCCPWGVLK